jgi:hypothetical protein
MSIRNGKVISTTNNSRIYKLLKREKLYSWEGKCFYCPPHGGCNRKNREQIKNWKKYRKTQYKIK